MVCLQSHSGQYQSPSGLQVKPIHEKWNHLFHTGYSHTSSYVQTSLSDRNTQSQGFDLYALIINLFAPYRIVKNFGSKKPRQFWQLIIMNSPKFYLPTILFYLDFLLYKYSIHQCFLRQMGIIALNFFTAQVFYYTAHTCVVT